MAMIICKSAYKLLPNDKKNTVTQVALDAVKKKVLAIILKIMYNKSRE